MSRAVMISIRPRWCELIADGEKTVEVRKTRPKIEPPFTCYIYCTKPKYKARKNDPRPFFWGPYSGTVIGEFVCDRIKTIAKTVDDMLWTEQRALITHKEMQDYFSGRKEIYGWHISELVFYDTPKELRTFHFPPERYCEKELCGGCPHDQVMGLDGDYAYDCEWERPLTRPPQSWCYVEKLED